MTFFQYFTASASTGLSDYPACALRALGLLLEGGALTEHNVYFIKYDVTVSFLETVHAPVADTVTYFAGLDAPVVDTVTYFGGNHGSRV